jgi:hypothetical protein
LDVTTDINPKVTLLLGDFLTVMVIALAALQASATTMAATASDFVNITPLFSRA